MDGDRSRQDLPEACPEGLGRRRERRVGDDVGDQPVLAAAIDAGSHHRFVNLRQCPQRGLDAGEFNCLIANADLPASAAQHHQFSVVATQSEIAGPIQPDAGFIRVALKGSRGEVRVSGIAVRKIPAPYHDLAFTRAGKKLSGIVLEDHFHIVNCVAGRQDSRLRRCAVIEKLERYRGRLGGTETIHQLAVLAAVISKQLEVDARGRLATEEYHARRGDRFSGGQRSENRAEQGRRRSPNRWPLTRHPPGNSTDPRRERVIRQQRGAVEQRGTGVADGACAVGPDQGLPVIRRQAQRASQPQRLVQQIAMRVEHALRPPG